MSRPHDGGGPSTVPARRARLDSLTGLRFAAAVLVVIHHVVRNDVYSSGLVSLPVLKPLATLGYTGVTFFFVLSGFVLTWSWRPAMPRQEFYVRRFARVYPLHLVTWVLAIPFVLAVTHEWSTRAAVVTLPLLQAWSPDSDITFGMNSVSWSLSCEAFFYACFPFLVRPISRLAGRGLLAVGAGALGILVVAPGVAYALGGRDAVAIFYYFPAYRIFEFVIGICLATAVARGWNPRIPRWSGAVAVVLSLALAAVGDHLFAEVTSSRALPRPAATLVMLPAFVLLILAGALNDVNRRRSLAAHPWMLLLGAWSFALYMTHLMLLTVLRDLPFTSDVVDTLGAPLSLLVLIGLCVALSWAAYTWVEHPVERWIRTGYVQRRGGGGGGAAATAPVTAPAAAPAAAAPAESPDREVDREAPAQTPPHDRPARRSRLPGSSAGMVGAMSGQVSQALASFGLQVVAARALGASGLGLFALLYGAIVLATALSSGLIGDSLTVLDRGDRPVRAALTRLAVLVATGCGLAAVAFGWLSGSLSLTAAVLFGLATTVFLLEDALRRLLMATMRFWSLPVVDFTSLAVSLVVLLVGSTTGTLEIGWFMGALAAGQLAALVVAWVRLPAAERHLPVTGPAALGTVWGFGAWRSLQMSIRPATLVAFRLTVTALVGLTLYGQLEAARVYMAPALILVSGMGSFLLPSYASAGDRSTTSLLAKADKAAVALLGGTCVMGLVAVAALPLVGDVLTGGDYTISRVAVLAWASLAAATAALTPYTTLAAVRGRQRAVTAIRILDPAISLVLLVPLTLLAVDLAPVSLALGSLVAGLTLRGALSRTTRPTASSSRAPSAVPSATPGSSSS